MELETLNNDSLACVVGGVVSQPNTTGSRVANWIGDRIGLTRDSSGDNLAGRIGGAMGQLWRSFRNPYILY